MKKPGGSCAGSDAVFKASDWLRTTRCEWTPLYTLLLYLFRTRAGDRRKKVSDDDAAAAAALCRPPFLNSWILETLLLLLRASLVGRPLNFSRTFLIYTWHQHTAEQSTSLPRSVGPPGRDPSCRSFGRSLFALVSFVCSVLLDPSCFPRATPSIRPPPPPPVWSPSTWQRWLRTLFFFLFGSCPDSNDGVGFCEKAAHNFFN